MLLRESDVQTEYPVDVDDENVTDSGFLPTLPGEYTRLSSALALFNASRILTKALEDLYPSRSSYELCVSKMRAISGQLDEWLKMLPAHLRLEFSQDKPSTNVTSSRSPLLVSIGHMRLSFDPPLLTISKSLVYYFIRSLIHRPAVCFAEENLRSPSILAMSDSSKHIIQILQLLDERRLCLSVSINRKELVFISGLGLLWQTLGLKRDSKLVKESQKLLANVVEQLEHDSPVAASEFTSLASTLVFLDTNKRGAVQSGKPAQEMVAPTQKPSRSPKRQLQYLKSRLMSNGNREESPKQAASRRNTISGASPPIVAQSLRSPSWASLPQQEHFSSSQYHIDHGRASLDLGSDPRLTSSTLGYDYQRAMSGSSSSDVTSGTNTNGAITMADWEYVLSDMDRGYSNIFTGIYGGRECGEDPGPFASITAEYAQKQNDGTLIPPPATDLPDLSPKAWSSSSGDFAPCQDHVAQSVLSYSGESMGSAEDANLHPFGDAPAHPDEMGLIDPFQAITMPAEGDLDEFSLVNGWDRRLAV